MSWGPTSGTQVTQGPPRSCGVLEDRAGSGVAHGGSRSASKAAPVAAHLTRGVGEAAAARGGSQESLEGALCQEATPAPAHPPPRVELAAARRAGMGQALPTGLAAVATGRLAAPHEPLFCLLHAFAGKHWEGDMEDAGAELGGAVRGIDLVRDAQAHDLRQEEVVLQLCREADEGTWDGVVGGLCCETWSVGSLIQQRSMEELYGCADLPPALAAKVAEHNILLTNWTRLLLRQWLSGGWFMAEHPITRRDPLIEGAFWAAMSDRPSLQDMPEFIALQRITGAVWIYAAYCAWRPGPQKLTMYLVTPDVASRAGEIITARCTHAKHGWRAWGRDALGRRAGIAEARYPREFGRIVARIAQALALASGSQEGEEGEIGAGPTLRGEVAAAVETARWGRSRFASFARLREVAPDRRWQQPMPEVPLSGPPPPIEPHVLAQLGARTTDSEGSDDESFTFVIGQCQRPPRRRPCRLGPPRDLNLRLAYWMLWLPMEEHGGRREGLERICTWWREAAQAQARMRRGLLPDGPKAIEVGPEFKHPHFRGRLVDSRHPWDCCICRRSTTLTRFPGRQMNRDKFREMAAGLGWERIDPDIVSQAGGGGLESFSLCSFSTVLSFHHTGASRNFEEADEVLRKDARERWVLGPFTEFPPMEPFRAVPRNVVLTSKTKQAEDGSWYEAVKARVTSNSSKGTPLDEEDSPNGGVRGEQSTLNLPTHTRHGEAAGVVDEYGDGDRIRGATYSIDGEAAFRFLLNQRAEWYLEGFVWDIPPLEGGPEVFGAWLDVRGWFGGAHLPNRYQRTLRVKHAKVRERQRKFDENHPFPPCALRMQRLRGQLQQAQLLPPGREQLVPADRQYFIDDDAGASLTDVTGVPPELRHIELSLVAMEPLHGVPAGLDTRVANHCRIDMDASLELEFAISPKSQCGDGVVSLGFQIWVVRHRLLSPLSKQGSLLSESEQVACEAGVGSLTSLKVASRVVGRLGHISCIEPELLLHMHPCYLAAALIEARSSRRHGHPLILGAQLGRTLRLALRAAHGIISANRGVPLLTAPAVEAVGRSDTLAVSTDSSRADEDDGYGGWGWNPFDPNELFVVSEDWPLRVRVAMAASAARSQLKASMSHLRFPMPAAELFGGWAVAEAIQQHLGHRFPGIVVIGDCKPAAAALGLRKSRSAPMRLLLKALSEGSESQYLGVWVPRELNTDADTLSHPSRLVSLVQRLTAMGFRVTVLKGIPQPCAVALDLALVNGGL